MFAVIFIPDFALQAALRFSPELWERPVALIPDETAKARLVQITPAASLAGVVSGMTQSQGLARCQELLIKRQSPPAERSAHAALLECAWSFSPWVEDTGEGVCTLRWDERLKPQLPLSRLQGLHLRARLGVAPNPDLALLAAQSTDSWRMIRQARELNALPLTMLNPPPHLLKVLRQWGVRAIGEFVALGREALVERLGPEVLSIFDRGAGCLERPLHCVPPAESFQESIEWENEIETLEPLLFMLRRFLEQIALRLEAVWLVIAELKLQLEFRDGEPYERIFKVPSPTRDVDVLFRMLHTHLESFRAEHPIRALHLTATPSRPARQQFGLFESALRDPNQFFETLARLGAILGDGRVGTPALEPTHRPDAFRIHSADFGNQLDRRIHGTHGALGLGLSLRRFRPAVPATVQFEQRPRLIRSAQISGPIVAAYGPMLLSGHWWNGSPWNRREWDIQLRDHSLSRIYEEAGAWFLEGFYD